MMKKFFWLLLILIDPCCQAITFNDPVVYGEPFAVNSEPGSVGEPFSIGTEPLSVGEPFAIFEPDADL